MMQPGNKNTTQKISEPLRDQVKFQHDLSFRLLHESALDLVPSSLPFVDLYR